MIDLGAPEICNHSLYIKAMPWAQNKIHQKRPGKVTQLLREHVALVGDMSSELTVGNPQTPVTTVPGENATIL